MYFSINCRAIECISIVFYIAFNGLSIIFRNNSRGKAAETFVIAPNGLYGMDVKFQKSSGQWNDTEKP
ncbi:MAG: hypothetical protein LBG43_11330 [Treponema sp.]|jgi:hypothetical protein|nr:hypothetical protein [Treponema sp.]